MKTIERILLKVVIVQLLIFLVVQVVIHEFDILTKVSENLQSELNINNKYEKILTKVNNKGK